MNYRHRTCPETRRRRWLKGNKAAEITKVKIRAEQDHSSAHPGIPGIPELSASANKKRSLTWFIDSDKCLNKYKALTHNCTQSRPSIDLEVWIFDEVSISWSPISKRQDVVAFSDHNSKSGKTLIDISGSQKESFLFWKSFQITFVQTVFFCTWPSCDTKSWTAAARGALSVPSSGNATFDAKVWNCYEFQVCILTQHKFGLGFFSCVFLGCCERLPQILGKSPDISRSYEWNVVACHTLADLKFCHMSVMC